MDFDWGDDSEDTSNVFSGVDDHKSRSTRGGSGVGRLDRINQDGSGPIHVKVVHAQRKDHRGRTVKNSKAEAATHPNSNSPRQSSNVTRVRNGSPTYRKTDHAETYYAPTDSPSPDNLAEDVERASPTSWFPEVTIPSISSFGWTSTLVSTAEHEDGRGHGRGHGHGHVHQGHERTGPDGSHRPRRKLRNSPWNKAASDAKAQASNRRVETKFKQPTTATSKNISNNTNPFGRKHSTNPFSSRSSSGSPPGSGNHEPRQKYNDPFGSISKSHSASTEVPKGYERVRSYSRSPSPVYQRPSRQTVKDVAKSEFHNILSCASSPTDEQFMKALEILATSKNPRQLAKMKLSNAHNWTALHVAGLSNPPLYLIYALLLVYPEGAKELDDLGRLPLHLAAGSENNVCLLNTLVRFHKESIFTKDDRGLIPLHLALLRDGDEEISVDVLRILLGQNIKSGDAAIKIGATSPRKVRDGSMRNGEHLNLQLDEIQGGILGTNRNAILAKERRQRETTMKLMSQGTDQHLSRGFARDINEVDSQDFNPHKHEHLSSLWMNEGAQASDPIEAMEMKEADKFNAEVQHCLKQLATWKKKYNREPKDDEIVEPEQSETILINPATIPAPPYMRLPVHMSVRRNHKKMKSTNNNRNDYPLATPPNQNEILRILIHAFPTSLMIQDSQNQTPLMTCLCLVHHPAIHPVDLDMIELLLGVRTAGYRTTPKWLEDAEFSQQHQNSLAYNSSNVHSAANGLTSNPAMISVGETLPLHIVAQEALPMSIVHAVYSCYPGAKYCQDDRNCTPLHLALQNLTGVDTLDIDMIRLLMDRRVLRMKNSLQQSIFDLLVANAEAGKLPRILKGTKCDNMKMAKSFQPIFDHAAIEEVLNSPSAVVDKGEFFSKLFSLPSWLRKQACATPAVQSILIKEIASRSNTAWILLYGIMMLVHTTSFISLVDSFLSAEDLNTVMTSNLLKIIALVTNLFLSLCSLSYTFMVMRLNVGLNQITNNLWSWVTCVALSSSLVVTVKIILQERALETVDLSDRSLYTLSTVAIGMLWAAFIGYLARWWYAISCFCSSIIKMAKGLITPIIVLTACTIASMQMVYIIHSRDATDNQCLYKEGSANGESLEICSLWDSFKIVYLLVIGEGFLGAEASSGDSTIVVLLIFVVVVFILILHTISLYILNAQMKGASSVMVDSYWSPILVHVLLMQNLKKTFCCARNREKSMPSRAEAMWDYMIFSFSDVDIKDTKWWYLQQDLGGSHLFGKKWFVRSVGFIFIPIWIFFGTITLGILWPPQVRQWIFELGIGNEDNINILNAHTVPEEISQRSVLQSDVANMKIMLYDRFQVIEKELSQLKYAVEESLK